MAYNRLKNVVSHIVSGSDDDVVIVSSARTAVARARKGNFRDTHPSDMLAAVLKDVCDRAGLPLEKVEDVCVGNVGMDGAMATQSRQAVLMAGFPQETCTSAVNRQCSSGLQAIMNIAAAIQAGHLNVGIGAGVESMSLIPMGSKIPLMSPNVMKSELTKKTLMAMGHTSDLVAHRYGLDRQALEAFAVESHNRALAAQKAGKFEKEITPVTTTVKVKDGDNEVEKTVVVKQDEGPRESTMAGMAKLRPAFAGGNPYKCEAVTTAGTSSQTSDGAAAVLMMKRKTARELGLKVQASIRSFAVMGCGPEEMGVGPLYAIPPALERAGVTKDQVDVYEVNEAFASQCLYCMRELGLDKEKVNPNGGAIALGHPLGCTGARQTATLIHELQRRGGGVGVVSMCIGTGMGAAGVFQVEA